MAAARLAGSMVRRADLTSGQREAMFALLGEHFENVSRDQFNQDLAEKQWVCLGIDTDSGEIGGFSTLLRLDCLIDGQPVTGFFSGDTIIRRRYWSQLSLLPSTIGRFIHQETERQPDRRTYWILLSSGYKTYRFLPVYFREFYPRYDRPTPADISHILDGLARRKYGDQYRDGIVRFRHPTPLRPGIADLDERRLRDHHVQFYVTRNPGHAQGDELVCITEMSAANLLPAARRFGLGERVKSEE